MSSGLIKESHEQSLATLKKPKLGPMVYHSIDQTADLFDDDALEGNTQLLCTEKEIGDEVEEDIKDGFFELKQKFRDKGPTSIYISHIVLHEKHPIFKKCDVNLLKRLLKESSVIYLNKDQILYRKGVV